MERHAVEDDQDLLQSPYAPKKEPTQPAIERDFAISGDAARRSSEGLREHLEQRAIDIHQPFLFSHDATGGQQELERLPASVRVERHAVENEHDPLQSPKKEPAQPAVEGDFAISEDAALLASEGFREYRRAADVHEPSFFSRDANGDQQEFERLVANIRVLDM